ncbi:unnamed protein product [Protopolystoma xenopodis]|uniref:Large ribosomal subunit protein uL10-like insertion domain-containing protein n=1 Tax=Protopolystoma xenopodis TaxID=117903 RepID=A0A3S5BS64_9PLAT|nr:unnamed protein product [Protopolystoma xenopodis]
MPVSKRDKKGSPFILIFLVDLTKLREQFDQYKAIYVLRIQNPRNDKISHLRAELIDSKLIHGRNTLISIALGINKSSEYKPGMHKLVKFIKHQCCILLTNCSYIDLRNTFNALRAQDFARPGLPASQKVYLSKGPVHRFSHTLEPELRRLGLPVKLIRGIVHLEKDCKKYFDIQMSEFRVNILASWSLENGTTDLSESDISDQVTSLHPVIKVSCECLDDKQYHFVLTPIECLPDDNVLVDVSGSSNKITENKKTDKPSSKAVGMEF